MVRGVIKDVDVSKNTVTIGHPASRGEQPDEKTFTITAGTEIGIDDGRGSRLSMKEGKLADLGNGMIVTIALGVDQKQAQSVMAEGPTVNGTVKSIDGGKSTITVAVMTGEREPEERTLDVAREAITLVDDGKGRLLSVKEVKLSDVPVGSSVALKLSPNQQSVMNVRAEGRRLPGLLKAVDPAKGTITVATFVARGENPEEKTYTVAKDARIMFEGNAVKLGDLKIEGDGSPAQMQLSIDQHTVQSIVISGARR
jgi:hypothetical protein